MAFKGRKRGRGRQQFFYGRCRSREVCARKNLSREPYAGFSQVLGQVATGDETVAGLARIEAVLTRPGAKHHLWVAQEIPVDGDVEALDGKGGRLQPGGIGVVGILPRGAPAQTQDVCHHPGAFLLKGGGWEANRTQEIGLASDLLPEAWVLLV